MVDKVPIAGFSFMTLIPSIVICLLSVAALKMRRQRSAILLVIAFVASLEIVYVLGCYFN